MLGSCIRLIWCHFYSCFLSNWLLAEKFSNCSNSLNFEAKINCNTTEPNVPKWRKTCTGLQFDIVHFNGPQSHILFVGNLWGPCIPILSRPSLWLWNFKLREGLFTALIVTETREARDPAAAPQIGAELGSQPTQIYSDQKYFTYF